MLALLVSSVHGTSVAAQTSATALRTDDQATAIPPAAALFSDYLDVRERAVRAPGERGNDAALPDLQQALSDRSTRACGGHRGPG